MEKVENREREERAKVRGRVERRDYKFVSNACASGNRLVYIYNTLHPVGWLVCHVLLEYRTVLYCTRAISHRTVRSV